MVWDFNGLFTIVVKSLAKASVFGALISTGEYLYDLVPDLDVRSCNSNVHAK